MTDRSIIPWDDDPDGKLEAQYAADQRNCGLGAIALIFLLFFGVAGAWLAGRL